MTALPPDPDPIVTSDPAGGGVEPGETPPDSASTSATANKNPAPRTERSPAMIATLIAVGLLFAVFLTVTVLYLLQVVGLMDRW